MPRERLASASALRSADANYSDILITVPINACRVPRGHGSRMRAPFCLSSGFLAAFITPFSGTTSSVISPRSTARTLSGP